LITLRAARSPERDCVDQSEPDWFAAGGAESLPPLIESMLSTAEDITLVFAKVPWQFRRPSKKR
jgi:hypothetical protein